MQRQRIYSTNGKSFSKEEKTQIGVVLLEHGYTVRCAKEKIPGKNTYKHFIEYWKEDIL